MDQHEKHPIVAGVVALVAVALAVGLVLGLAALGATRVLGLGGDDGGSSSGGGASLVIPPAPETDEPVEEPSSSAPAPGEASEPAPEKSEDPAQKLTLQASTTQADPWEQIDFSGTWPAGEGKLLRMERRAPGEKQWSEFEISHFAVSGGRFHTFLMTSRTGVNQFRVAEVDGTAVSNVVKVTIG